MCHMVWWLRHERRKIDWKLDLALSSLTLFMLISHLNKTTGAHASRLENPLFLTFFFPPTVLTIRLDSTLPENLRDCLLNNSERDQGCPVRCIGNSDRRKTYNEREKRLTTNPPKRKEIPALLLWTVYVVPASLRTALYEFKYVRRLHMNACVIRM